MVDWIKALWIFLVVVPFRIAWSAAISGGVVFVVSSLIIGACAWLIGAHDVRAAALALSVPLTVVAAGADVLINMFRFMSALRKGWIEARIAAMDEDGT